MRLSWLGKIFLLVPIVAHAGLTLEQEEDKVRHRQQPGKYSVCFFNTPRVIQTLFRQKLGTTKFQYWSKFSFRSLINPNRWLSVACNGIGDAHCDLIVSGKRLANKVWFDDATATGLESLDKLSCVDECKALRAVKAVFLIDGLDTAELTRKTDLETVHASFGSNTKIFVGSKQSDLWFFFERNQDFVAQLEQNKSTDPTAFGQSGDLCSLYDHKIPFTERLRAVKKLLDEKKLARYLPSLLYFYDHYIQPGAIAPFPDADPKSGLKITPLPRYLPTGEVDAILTALRMHEGARAQALKMYEDLDTLDLKLRMLELMGRFGWLADSDRDAIAGAFLKKTPPDLCKKLEYRPDIFRNMTKAALPAKTFSDVKTLETLGCLRTQDVEIHRELLKLMGGKNEDLADEAAQALVTIGPESLEIQRKLIEFAVGRNAFLQNPATAALRNVKPAGQSLARELFADFDKRDPATKQLVVSILSKWAPQDLEIAEALAAHLSSAGRGLRTSIIEALGNIGLDSPKIAAALVAEINDPLALTRAKIAAALNDIQTKQEDAHIALARALNDPEELVRTNAKAALKSILPQTQGGQLELVRIASDGAAAGSPDSSVLLGLCTPSNPKVHEALIQALENEDPVTSHRALYPLKQSKNISAQLQLRLLKAMKSELSQLAHYAVEVLSQQRDLSEPAIQVLADSLRDAKAQIRLHAAIVFREILPSDLRSQRSAAMLLTDKSQPVLQKIILEYFQQVPLRDPSFMTLLKMRAAHGVAEVVEAAKKAVEFQEKQKSPVAK